MGGITFDPQDGPGMRTKSQFDVISNFQYDHSKDTCPSTIEDFEAIK